MAIVVQHTPYTLNKIAMEWSPVANSDSNWRFISEDMATSPENVTVAPRVPTTTHTALTVTPSLPVSARISLFSARDNSTAPSSAATTSSDNASPMFFLGNPSTMSSDSSPDNPSPMMEYIATKEVKKTSGLTRLQEKRQRHFARSMSSPVFSRQVSFSFEETQDVFMESQETCSDTTASSQCHEVFVDPPTDDDNSLDWCERQSQMFAQNEDLPSRFSQLFTAPLLEQPQRISASRESLVFDRKRRSMFSDVTPQAKRPLRKCQSETDEVIKSILCKVDENPDLLADGSKYYALPTIRGQHPDLKSITSQTLTSVLNGDYKEDINSVTIIDCRYPYEFESGHIQGAINLYTRDMISDKFLCRPPICDGRRDIIIFHCEFSSERAPKLCRFLRHRDRDMHADVFPSLSYPEVYVLHSGYKSFYESHIDLCEPQGYKPMLHKDHREDLRKFRLKSKSWPVDKRARAQSCRVGLRF